MTYTVNPSHDLTETMRRVSDIADLLPCGAEHSYSAQLRRDCLVLRDKAGRPGWAGQDLVAEAEHLLDRIGEYLNLVTVPARGGSC